MKYTEIRVRCNTAQLERVSAVMSMLDPHMMIKDYSDIAEGLNTVYGDLIDEEILTADKSVAEVSIFVPENRSYIDLLAFLRERLAGEEPMPEITLIGVEDEDWANAWRKYYKPVNIGSRLVIVPAWQDYTPKENEIIVRMDPGMAFGTGTHETTRLCAALLESSMPLGARVLDIGTGSGIIAICASKLGASSVDACDIDPDSVRIAAENAAENGVCNIRTFKSDLLGSVTLDGGLYDFVSANIVADVLIRLAPDIGKFMKFGASAAFSGIIADRQNDVLDAMTDAGFSVSDITSENDWRGMLFTKLK